MHLHYLNQQWFAFDITKPLPTRFKDDWMIEINPITEKENE